LVELSAYKNGINDGTSGNRHRKDRQNQERMTAKFNAYLEKKWMPG
jgi:hypothetical protein